MNTKESIMTHTAHILAKEGVAGTSMRKVAAAVGIEVSVIYSHFPNKLALLRATREHITMRLAIEMQHISHDGSASGRLYSMLLFQMRSRDIILALLQYFMVIREDFTPNAGGYIPSRAYQHIREIIVQGIDEGVFESKDVEFDAKAINHLINGFLMEYFNHDINETRLEQIVTKIHHVILRTLTAKKGTV